MLVNLIQIMGRQSCRFNKFIEIKRTAMLATSTVLGYHVLGGRVPMYYNSIPRNDSVTTPLPLINESLMGAGGVV